jgi:hypothetical protein
VKCFEKNFERVSLATFLSGDRCDNQGFGAVKGKRPN